MSAAAALGFNLAVNAVGSFVGAAAMVAVARRVFRVPEGRYRALLLAVPLAKVVVDAARGVPAGSFLWAQLGGAQQELGSLQVGLGLEAPLVPVVQLALSAEAGGRRYSQSLAEAAMTGLTRRGVSWSWVPWALGAVALGLLAASAAEAWASAARAGAARRGGRVVERRALGRRVVEVVVSPAHAGAPFAGGLWRPYVCLSEATFTALPADEREAVIEHELGHLAHHDLLLLGAVSVLADALWFVPGLRAQCRAVAAQCEIAADERATARGVDPDTMASALVRVAETAPARPSPRLALVRPGRLLGRRVRRLLASPAPPARLGFGSPLGRALITSWVAVAVLASSLLGNR